MRYLLITTAGALVNTAHGNLESVTTAGETLAKNGIASYAAETDAPLSAGPVSLKEVARFGNPSVGFDDAYARWTARQSQGRAGRSNQIFRG